MIQACFPALRWHGLLRHIIKDFWIVEEIYFLDCQDFRWINSQSKYVGL